MHGPIVSPVPIMLKHPILARIDEISRDPAKVAAMRDLLNSSCGADALADVAVKHGICPRPLADFMLSSWANVSGDGWLGEIMAEVRRGTLEVCEALLAGAPPLSSWWILGLTERLHMRLLPMDDQLLLFMTTPMLPHFIIRASKMPLLAPDPYFRPMIQKLRDDLDQMLATATP